MAEQCVSVERWKGNTKFMLLGLINGSLHQSCHARCVCWGGWVQSVSAGHASESMLKTGTAQGLQVNVSL